MSRLKPFVCLFLIQLIIVVDNIAQEIAIDHLIVLVKNLVEAKKEYAAKGFTIKEGKQHANGLWNAHIKFPNKSSFELMSISGIPTDEIARNYQKLLTEGEGGVFVALTGFPIEVLQKKLNEANVKHQVMKGKLWSYLTFPEDSPLSLFFFITYHKSFHESQQYYQHQNRVKAIERVVVEGSTLSLKLFSILGFNTASARVRQDEAESYIFPTTTGEIEIRPGIEIAKRPRIISIIFKSNSEQKLSISLEH